MSSTIGKDIRQKLRDAAGSSGVGVETAGEGVVVSVDVDGCDRYAAGIRGLRVNPAEPLNDVGGVAERIADRVDVIDRLKVIEYDAPQGEAILRSAEPEADEAGVTYWEATVKPDETAVHRYHKAHAEPDRQVIVEPAMHREIGELADQIVDAINGAAE